MQATDFSDGCRSADDQVRSQASWILNHEGPDAAFVYLEGVDEAGHRHDEDEVDVRRSFLLLHRIGPEGVEAQLREAVAGRGPLRSEEVTPLLLNLIGVRDGRWDAGHEVGARRDVPSTGPTRDLRYEW